MNKQVATLGGGCFWCLEAVYQDLKGVESVVSGYAGGHVKNPTYRAVCAETTGHAEVVQITYDADIVSFKEILDVFFTIHDPTTLNRQGNDIGTQYRSAVFTHDETQKQITEQTIAEVESTGMYSNKIVTDIEPLEVFYPAEAYHQNYFRNNPTQGYCQFVVAPKVAKFRKTYLNKLKA